MIVQIVQNTLNSELNFEARRVIPISRSETNDISALYVRRVIKIKEKVDGIPTASFIQMRPVFEVCDPISELPVKSKTLTGGNFHAAECNCDNLPSLFNYNNYQDSGNIQAVL